MDSSINGCYFNDKVLEYFYTFLKEQDKTLYDLISFVIMPNHVHILFKQLQPISEVIRVLKAKSAININKIMKVHFEKVYRHIYENPLKVELGLKFRYYSIYEDLDADMPII